MVKHEWRKQEKALYIPKDEPTKLIVPKMRFIVIQGEGNPNGSGFAERIGVLYSLAYAIRMMPKNGTTPPGYFEYTVYPLEGVWDLSEQGRAADTMDPDELIYTIMIRQPEFVTDEVFEQAMATVCKKKPHDLLADARFEIIDEGPCVQMLHVGPFSTEHESFEQMDVFCKEWGLTRSEMTHREIYLSDYTKVAPDKLKTTLRYKVTES